MKIYANVNKNSEKAKKMWNVGKSTLPLNMLNVIDEAAIYRPTLT